MSRSVPFHKPRLSIDRRSMFPLGSGDEDTDWAAQRGPVTSCQKAEGTLMNRPIRAIVYGFLIWWLWFAFVGLAQLLPDDMRAHPSFAMTRLLVLVLLVVAFAVDYLRRVERSSVGEGLAVGLTWMALMIANDIGHFLADLVHPRERQAS